MSSRAANDEEAPSGWRSRVGTAYVPSEEQAGPQAEAVNPRRRRSAWSSPADSPSRGVGEAVFVLPVRVDRPVLLEVLTRGCAPGVGREQAVEVVQPIHELELVPGVSRVREQDQRPDDAAPPGRVEERHVGEGEGSDAGAERPDLEPI